MNEQEMRDSEAANPKTLEELSKHIDGLVSRDHDYGTCVYAMSLSAVATFNYVAHNLGVTGFQASCADLDILKRTRGMKGPFMIIDADNMLYPQYNLHEKLRKAMESWANWAAEQAALKLAESPTHTHPDVRAHWESLVKAAQK